MREWEGESVSARSGSRLEPDRGDGPARQEWADGRALRILIFVITLAIAVVVTLF